MSRLLAAVGSRRSLTPLPCAGIIQHTMGPVTPRRQDQADVAPRILGDLLFADMQTPVSEKDWVGLVEGMARGDQGALRALYQRTHRLVFTLIVRITGNRASAEELTLDVFHDVWRRASTYDPANGSVIGWIMNQARSRAIDRVRFDRRRKRANPQTTDPPPAAAPRDPLEACDLSEQGRLLRDALMVLRSEERQAIELAFFSELTHDDVAARLNQPLGTIKTRIRSGLVKLRRALVTALREP